MRGELSSGWQAQHIFFSQPLFGVEYAIALLAALQVWQKPDGPTSFRRALSLGGTGATTRELYAAAGAEFAFDEQALFVAIERVEEHIQKLS